MASDQPDQLDANATPAVSGQAAPTAKAPPRRRRSRVWILAAVIVLLVGGYVGYGYVQDQMLYVSTDNAMVMGSLVPVGSLNAGRIDSMAVDIGQPVTAGEQVLTVTIPAEVTTTGSGTPKMAFRSTEDQSAVVASPINGVVVARNANPGDTISAGQTILTLVDPRSFWVQANIDETQIGRIHLGDPVQVHVDTLGQTLNGRVLAVNDATAATFSLLPQNNTQGNFTKVTQLVPVKIAFDYGDAYLVLGSSVEIRIRVQN
jgi:multidrug resistance efflux pump